ncbi:hypothetical protein OG21DRAFT_1511193 [Imleria badia]|nr:hypothetical protein OG21DRAFT_1511193 [Imleria badia]
MPGWALVDTHPTHGRTFKRPLSEPEIGFVLEGLFNGTTDSVHHYELRLSNGSQDAHLFSEANIVRAWVSTKRRFPLAGATVRGADSAPLQLKVTPDLTTEIGTGFESEPHFVVREHDLAVVRPREIVFGSVASAEDAQRQAAAMLHGPRQLSEELLGQLYVFHETDSERAHILHLMLLIAHSVTDGAATRTFVRCLLDTLARGDRPEPAQIPLEERLAMAISSMDLRPAHLRSLSLAIQRWRRAIGMVIFQLRISTRQGGHTLPCRITHSTPYIPARPGGVSTTLTHTQTTTVISNCRLHDLTFGNAYLTLAQVAMTRVLYRRYLRGEISGEEWAHRRKQPYLNGGPLNLRRYLDNAWFENGGGGEFILSISLFNYRLPFMTLGTAAERHHRVWSDGAPPFSELLTFDRFLHRARLVKKQATEHFNHPLFFEIMDAMIPMYIRYAQPRAVQWVQRAETTTSHDTHGDSEEDKVLAATDIPSIPAHGGSSLGNLDLISPTEYPLPPTHPLSPYSSVPHPVKAGYVTPPSPPPSGSEADTTQKITVVNWRTHLYTRPAELILAASTTRGELNMYAQFDGNVFEEGVVTEWLDEVREAVLWYLGRPQ